MGNAKEPAAQPSSSKAPQDPNTARQRLRTMLSGFLHIK